jgi:sulfide dehydrogenase cytochrome subunit
MGHRSRTSGPGLLKLAALAAALSATLAGCGGGTDSAVADLEAAGKSRPSSTSTTTATTTVAQPTNTEGRLLASNCFQCHGTMGLGGFDKIRGSEASEVLEFMTKTASRDIMAAHAQGYTPEQLKKIIAYLQQ